MAQDTKSEFEAFRKIPRLSRDIIVTEKLDGTNAQIYITEDGQIMAGSRNRWIMPKEDNYGFAKWVEARQDELLELGPGRHFGEWWGQGIQRGYDLKEKRFSLFNMQGILHKPACVSIVPVLYEGTFSEGRLNAILGDLRRDGSVAAPGFMKPEGIVIFHTAARVLFKKTIEGDDSPKGQQ